MDFIPVVIFLLYHGRKTDLSGRPAGDVLAPFLVLYHRAEFCDSPGSSGLPSLFRFIFTVAALAGLVYVGMLALTTFVTPEPHEIVQTLPASRLNK